MKKVIILGGTGMVGHALVGGLSARFHIIPIVRDLARSAVLTKRFPNIMGDSVIVFDVKDFMDSYYRSRDFQFEFKDFFQTLVESDYVINAIGITPPLAQADRQLTLFVNGVLPHLFSGILREKFIHISTDCVFDGLEGHPYTEISHHHPVDYYGFTKSVGEPHQSFTIRTSFIGREIDSSRGLLEWFLRQEGKRIEGYQNCIWNGVTTHEFARVCTNIVEHLDMLTPLRTLHIFSSPISKFDMLKAFQKKFNIDCEIIENTAIKRNRTLSSIHSESTQLHIPSFYEMLEMMPNDL
ncbi:sugar nucleotide-binding protein [Candidatus Uhrbacteria bacterium]|nr:sugar nucleotide-binding protein [Candidatus Uhrbacteria bacterium]